VVPARAVNALLKWPDTQSVTTGRPVSLKVDCPVLNDGKRFASLAHVYRLLRSDAVREHAERRAGGRPVPGGAPNDVPVRRNRRPARGERDDGERDQDHALEHVARIDHVV
jgi:hypothetical protein